MRKESSDFNTYVRLETQSVGSVTGLMTSSLIMRSSSAWIFSQSWTGARRGACMVGLVFSLSMRLYLPGSLPIPLKRSKYSSMTYSNDCIGAPCSVFIL